MFIYLWDYFPTRKKYPLCVTLGGCAFHRYSKLFFTLYFTKFGFWDGWAHCVITSETDMHRISTEVKNMLANRQEYEAANWHAQRLHQSMSHDMNVNSSSLIYGERCTIFPAFTQHYPSFLIIIKILLQGRKKPCAGLQAASWLVNSVHIILPKWHLNSNKVSGKKNLGPQCFIMKDFWLKRDRFNFYCIETVTCW